MVCIIQEQVTWHSLLVSLMKKTIIGPFLLRALFNSEDSSHLFQCKFSLKIYLFYCIIHQIIILHYFAIYYKYYNDIVFIIYLLKGIFV